MRSIVVFYAVIGIALSATNYDGYRVYRITPSSEQHLNLLKALYGTNDYDFWTSGARIGQNVDVMISEDQKDLFLEICNKYGLETKTFIPDVQRLIDTENKGLRRTTIMNAEMQWDQYYTLDEIYSWMDQLSLKYPNIVSVYVAGNTYEERPIKYLKISFGGGRKAVYIEGGIHAREWISPATTSFMINQLLTSQNATIRKIAESYDWYITPVANPDGYVYTHMDTRLWRKNRSPNSICYGVDGNRNWNVHWGESGTSTNQCDETYGGTSAASELETIHLSKLIDSIGSNLEVFLSFHSYGNMMLMPYGHTTDHLDNYDDVLAVGQAAANALAAVNGTKYAVGNTAETIYSHSGGTMDWVKLNHKPPIAFTYEVKGSPGGFVLPPEYIIINCQEVLESFITIFTEGDRMGLITLI